MKAKDIIGLAVVAVMVGVLVKIEFFPSKADSRQFPRVAKNLCGQYAVQTLSWNRGEQQSDGTYKYTWDTAFVGLRSSIVGFVGGYIVGFAGPPDTTSIEYIKKRFHALLWVDTGDTIYNAYKGFELTFNTQEAATAAMNSYLNRKNKESAFLDSLMRCHIYQ